MTSKKSPLRQLRDDYSVLISRSKSKDIEASKELLRKASTYIGTGKPLPTQLAEWLSKNLKAIADGADPKATFNLTRSRGRPPSYNRADRAYIAESIHLSKSGGHKSINKDESTKGSHLQAGEKHRIHSNTAGKYAKNQQDIDQMGEEIDREIRQENEE